MVCLPSHGHLTSLAMRAPSAAILTGARSGLRNESGAAGMIAVCEFHSASARPPARGQTGMRSRFACGSTGVSPVGKTGILPVSGVKEPTGETPVRLTGRMPVLQRNRLGYAGRAVASCLLPLIIMVRKPQKHPREGTEHETRQAEARIHPRQSRVLLGRPGRQDARRTPRCLKAAGAEVVVPSPKDTKVGCVESLEEAAEGRADVPRAAGATASSSRR